ncbi:MAG TPA: exosortase A [Dissulfurispiraceae bacterium]|nr:exosortase A [Dissulfurispiraceae bacterium]
MEQSNVLTVSQTLRRYRIEFGLLVLLLAGIYAKIVPEMVMQWNNDENYSHGFIVPFIAGYFFWQRRREIMELQTEQNWQGLGVIGFGLFMLLMGFLATEYFTMRSSLVVLLIGMVFFFLGKEVLKAMALPLGYLFFMVPIPYIIYDAAAFPLKLFVAKVSVFIMKISGVMVLREGNIIMLANTTLEVADACSGLRSLMSLIALAVAYAFMTQQGWLKRIIVIASALPIAVLTNMFRVIATGFLAQYWGAGVAEGFFHEFAGLAVFGVAMVLLVATGEVLRRFGR